MSVPPPDFFKVPEFETEAPIPASSRIDKSPWQSSVLPVWFVHTALLLRSRLPPDQATGAALVRERPSNPLAVAPVRLATTALPMVVLPVPPSVPPVQSKPSVGVRLPEFFRVPPPSARVVTDRLALPKSAVPPVTVNESPTLSTAPGQDSEPERTLVLPPVRLYVPLLMTVAPSN